MVEPGESYQGRSCDLAEMFIKCPDSTFATSATIRFGELREKGDLLGYAFEHTLFENHTILGKTAVLIRPSKDEVITYLEHQIPGLVKLAGTDFHISYDSNPLSNDEILEYLPSCKRFN